MKKLFPGLIQRILSSRFFPIRGLIIRMNSSRQRRFLGGEPLLLATKIIIFIYLAVKMSELIHDHDSMLIFCLRLIDVIISHILTQINS